jgi:hypothetical protein
VVEIDLLRQRVKVRMEEEPETINIFSNTEIAVLRSGKAKKNDPPIPADLAPISGGGKRVRKEPESEEKLLLEPIRFRYSTEKIVEEKEEPEEIPEESGENKPSRSRNRRRKPKTNAEEQPKQEPKPEKPRKEPRESKEHKEPKEPREPKTEAEGDGEKKPRRRPNHRRRKPGSKPAGEGQQ